MKDEKILKIPFVGCTKIVALTHAGQIEHCSLKILFDYINSNSMNFIADENGKYVVIPTQTVYDVLYKYDLFNIPKDNKKAMEDLEPYFIKASLYHF